MTTTLRLALAALLAAGAALAALLAADVRSWGSSLPAGDAVYAATPSRASWRPSTRLDGAAEALLGVGGDLQLREALQRYVNASKLRLRLDNAAEVEAARARAEDALARVARSSDPRRAAQALTLLGVLAFRESASGGAQSQVDAALTDFADAARAYPAAEDPAYDLELLLRLSEARGLRVEPGQGSGFGRSGRRGAGSGQPGSGY